MEIIIRVVGLARRSRIGFQSNNSERNMAITVPAAPINIAIEIFTPLVFASQLKYAPKVIKSPWAKFDSLKIP
jgi:hypothetical protein